MKIKHHLLNAGRMKHPRASTLLTSILFVNLFVDSSHAYSIDDLLSRSNTPGACKQSARPQETNLTQLISQATALKQQAKYCKAASYFSAVMNYSETPEQFGWSWSERIESLFFQYDYESVLLESEHFITLRPGSQFEKKVRLILVKAVHELAMKNPTLANPWFQLSLGIHTEQLNPESFKRQSYSLNSFLEKYPHSAETVTIQDWKKQLHDHLSTDLVKKARHSRFIMDFVPALVQYQAVLSQGPSLSEFSVSVFELIQTLKEFSSLVTNEKVITDQRLAIWMFTTPELISADTRRNLQAQLLSQAKDLYSRMLVEIPSDPWTVRARQEFAF